MGNCKSCKNWDNKIKNPLYKYHGKCMKSNTGGFCDENILIASLDCEILETHENFGCILHENKFNKTVIQHTEI